MTISGRITILSGIRSRGRSIGDWLNLMNILSISIVDLLANLLGESEINSLASRSSKLGDALLFNLNIILHLWDSDALLLCEVLAADSWERDWLVDTGLDWLRVGNLNSWLNRGDNRDIVASLLGNLLAVVVSITVVSVSWGWLVRVGADLIVNFLNALGTDSTGDWVALFYINNDLDSKLNEVAGSLKSRVQTSAVPTVS